MAHCALCNESFEPIAFELGEVVQIEDEYWHVECYTEYFGEVPETDEAVGMG